MCTCVGFENRQHTVPINKELLEFDECDTFETLIVPEGAILKSVKGKFNLKTIKFPNGQISVDEGFIIRSFKVTKDYYIIDIMTDAPKTSSSGREIKYGIINKENLEVIQEGTLYLTSDDPFGNLIYQYDYIDEIDLDNVDDEMLFYIGIGNVLEYYSEKNDGQYKIKHFFYDASSEEVFSGKIYTKEEVKKIRETLEEIVSKVNVPPEGLPNREKIIYSQLVQSLREYLVYDHKTAELIETTKKDTSKQMELSKEEIKKIDESQNLKGLLGDRTVCAGFATIMEALCHYFNIDCEVLSNDDHAWNYVKLDGKYYEDDFTWYIDNLKDSNILGINTFLKGRGENGKRTFAELEYHQLEDDSFQLDEDLPVNQMFNLLSTDWSNIKDWGNIDIENPDLSAITAEFYSQIEEAAGSKKTICLVALKKIKNKFILSSKNFINKVQDLVFGKQDR